MRVMATPLPPRPTRTVMTRTVMTRTRLRLTGTMTTPPIPNRKPTITRLRHTDMTTMPLMP